LTSIQGPTLTGPECAFTINRMSAGADSAITVGVRLGQRLGPGHRSVRLPAGATVADLLAELAPALGLAPERLASVAVAVGGDVVGRDRPLRDGDALVLVLPIAGG
jgi:sulfur carrier protein ThiS